MEASSFHSEPCCRKFIGGKMLMHQVLEYAIVLPAQQQPSPCHRCSRNSCCPLNPCSQSALSKSDQIVICCSSGIASITPRDLASFIATWQRPDSAILGLVGDFDSQQMLQTIKQVGLCCNTQSIVSIDSLDHPCLLIMHLAH